MANEIKITKTLILREKDYSTWEDFTFLLCELYGQLPNDEDIEKLHNALMNFNFSINMQIETEDGEVIDEQRRLSVKGERNLALFCIQGVDKKYLLCYNVGPRPLEAVRSADPTPIWQIFMVV